MANQPWLEQVERQLTGSKLPPAYIRRFMDELADHFEDITEDTMSNETSVLLRLNELEQDATVLSRLGELEQEATVLSRLGEPEQVADAAVVTYQRRTFFGRHPAAKLLVFGISPAAAMLLVFILACFGVIAFGTICEKCGVRLADQDYLGRLDPAALSWGFSLVTTILPAALLTIVYCGCARRFSLSKKWMLASCGVLAFVAMLPIQSILLSDAPGKSMWTIGLELPPNLLQCVQLVVPIAVGLWFVLRPSEQRPQEDQLRMAV